MKASSRKPDLDIFRGVGVCLMIPFHFFVDLRGFGSRWTPALKEVPWPYWRAGGIVIATIFLLSVGAGVWLGPRRWKPRVRGALRVLAAGALISAASFYATPTAPIYFGILHCIAVSYLLAGLFPEGKGIVALAGIAMIAVGIHFQFHPVGAKWLLWLVRPADLAMADHFPLLPWSGIVLVGMYLARRWYASPRPAALPGKSLQFLGRHSLSVYLLHQPVMIGLLWAAGVIRF